MQHCRHCGDDLPDNAPPDVTSGRSYANWRARQSGDTLTAFEADALTVLSGLCEMYVATRDGLEMLPDLD